MQAEQTTSSFKFTGQKALFTNDDDEDEFLEQFDFDVDNVDISMLKPYPLKINSKRGNKIVLDEPASPRDQEEFDQQNDVPFEMIFPDEDNPFREATSPSTTPSNDGMATQNFESSAIVTPEKTIVDSNCRTPQRANGKTEINPTVTRLEPKEEKATSPIMYSARVSVVEHNADELTRSIDTDTSQSEKADLDASSVIFAGLEDEAKEPEEKVVPNQPAQSNTLAFQQDSLLLTMDIDEYELAKFHFQLSNLASSNQNFTQVTIKRSQGGLKFRTRTLQDLEKLFNVMRSFSNVHTLELTNFKSCDLEKVNDLLFAHPTLRHLRLHMIDEPIDQATLRAIASIPHIEELTLNSAESFPFDILLRSQSLRKIKIASTRGDPFENSHLMPLVQMIESNTTLREIDLEPPMSFIAFKLLAYALRVNTCIENFRLSVSGLPKDADSAIDEIITVLDRNKTLKRLWNYQYSTVLVSPDRQENLLKAIEKSAVLDSFLFFDEDATFLAKKEKALGNRGTSIPSFLSGLPTCGTVPTIEFPKFDMPTVDKDRLSKLAGGFKSSFDSLVARAKAFNIPSPSKAAPR